MLMKKISKLLIGTNNVGKYKEIIDLLPKYIKTHSKSDFKLKSQKKTDKLLLKILLLNLSIFQKKLNYYV